MGALQFAEEEGFCRHCKSYSVCDYCSCLRMHGQEEETCCSLGQWNGQGGDNHTAWPFCQPTVLVYNSLEGSMKKCDLDYDLLPFYSFAKYLVIGGGFLPLLW